MPRKATRVTKGTQIRDALTELLTSLQQHGDVTITARVGGATFTIRMDDAPARGGAARAIASEAGLPSATQVLEVLHDNPLGMRLKELASEFAVKPRNRLKPLIARLIEERRVKPAGRRFRAADVVVRRGRKPGSGAVQAARPGRRRRR